MANDEAKYAVVVIAYNRTAALNRLLERLSVCKYYGDVVDLHIRIDKSDNYAVKELAEQYQWNYGDKVVTVASERLGLKKNILGCGELLDCYEAIAILEDDIVPSVCFYNYMRQAVPAYNSDENIAGLSLYSYRVNQRTRRPFEPLQTDYDAFFIQHAVSWGQVWMKESWKSFEKWYETNKNKPFDDILVPADVCAWGDKSWLKHHIKYCIKCNKYFVMPYVSLTTNFHCEGEHSMKQNALYQVPLCRIGKKYRFPQYNADALKYDAFFENEGLWAALQIERDKLTIDLYGAKRQHKRYWLTEHREPYKVLKSFGLATRPIETNILDCQEGGYFFLYDTSVKELESPAPIDELERLSFDVSDYLSRGLLSKLLTNNISEAIKKKLRR